MRYKLKKWGDSKGDNVFISKEQVIEMYEQLKDKSVTGFVYPLEKIKNG